MNLPLANIRVLDFTQMLAGPYCTMILADLGAEVIKIEPPSGDEVRTSPPYFVGPDSLYYLTVNRNKKGLVIDLKKASGLEVVRDLVKVSDVVVHNFRPGVAERLGIAYKELSAVNPQIVYCHLTSFGESGPYANLPGYDLIVQAISGGMSITGEPGLPPVRAGIPIGDLAGGMLAAIGILSGLVARSLGLPGRKLSVSLLDGQISCLTYHASYSMFSGKPAQPCGTGHPSLVVYQMFKARDKYFVLIGHRTPFWENLCRAVGRAELIEDPRFNTREGRLRNKDELVAILQSEFEKRDCDYWLNLFRQADVPCAPVNDVLEALQDNQVMVNEMVMLVEDPARGSSYRLAGNPIKFEGATTPVQPAPLLGQHTGEVLRRVLGYDDAKRSKLLEEKAIITADGEVT